MGVYRMYTGDDGESHIEEIDLEKHEELTYTQFASGVRLNYTEAGPASAFKPEPTRRWMCLLKGRFEVGLGDGSKHQFGPGDIRLIEDTTGRGHTSAWLEPSTWVVVEIDPEYGPGGKGFQGPRRTWKES